MENCPQIQSKTSKKGKFTSNYKVSPINFETQISLRRYAPPNISPSKRAFEKYKSRGLFWEFYGIPRSNNTLSTKELVCLFPTPQHESVDAMSVLPSYSRIILCTMFKVCGIAILGEKRALLRVLTICILGQELELLRSVR